MFVFSFIASFTITLSVVYNLRRFILRIHNTSKPSSYVSHKYCIKIDSHINGDIKILRYMNVQEKGQVS